MSSIIFRTLLSLSVLVLIDGQPAFAQSAKPVPPPAIKTAGSYVYKSVAGGFEAKFPAKPTVQVLESESSFGKVPIAVTYLTTSLADYSVTYTDFPTIMDDKYDLNVRFDAMRDSQAKRLSARTVKDEELYVGAYYGRANVFETNVETHSTRTIVAGPRLFVIVVTSRGKLSTLTEKLRASAQRRVDDFFEGFVVTKVAEAATAPVELPADFQVSVNGRKFESKFFGFNMLVPEDWRLLEGEESDLVMELGKSEIKRTNPALVAHLTEQTTRVLGMFRNAPLGQSPKAAMLFLLVERAPYPNFKPSAVAKSYLQLYLDANEKVVKAPATITIGGAEFAWIETRDSSNGMNHRVYFANRQGISFQISMTYFEPTDLAPMLASLETMKFADIKK